MADWKDLLKGKLTDEKVVDSMPRPKQRLINHAGDNYLTPWWLRREFLRMEHGIYTEPTEVLTWFNGKLPHFALHISKEDPNYIAYTPDRASGEGDRQLKTTLGKFIAKYYPHYPDQVVTELTAEHLAEATGVLEILRGQDLINFYNRPINGLSSCMAKGLAQFTETDGHHPAEVYDMPHIGLAITRDKSGTINARCLVYEVSETDKRWIRVYGDSKLTKLLGRNGYKVGTWVGAEFKLIPLPHLDVDNATGVLMPYLDGNGTAGGEARSSVMLFNDKLICVDRNKFASIRHAAGVNSCVVATSTSGVAKIVPTNSDSAKVKCAVSGVLIDTMTETAFDYHLNGAMVKVCFDVYEAGKTVWCRTYTRSSPIKLRVGQDAPTFYDSIRDQYILEGLLQRDYAGYFKLNEQYYPDEQEWVAPYNVWGDAPEGYKLTTTTGWIKMADATQVILGGDTTGTSWVHQQSITLGYVKVHSLTRGVDLYAAPDVEIHKTPTNRKVVAGVHDIRMTIDGQWEFNRNLEKRRAFNTSYWINRNAPHALSREQSFKLLELVAEQYQDQTPTQIGATTVRRCFSEYIVLNGMPLYRHPRAYTGTWTELMTATRDWITSNSLSDELTAQLSQLDYWVTLQIAEAEAIDYNHQHTVQDTYQVPLADQLYRPPEAVYIPLPTTSISSTGAYTFHSGTGVSTTYPIYQTTATVGSSTNTY